MLLLHRIANAPCLRYYDPDLPSVLHTDASIYGIGGWLGQLHQDGLHPVLFWSRRLIPAETNYPTHERELLALVKCCEKFRPMLLGSPFLAKTDHRALIHLQTQAHLSRRQVRWVEQLQEFPIEVEYIPGQRNQLADLLSRSPEFAPICSSCKTKKIEIDSTEISEPDLASAIRTYFQAHPGVIPPGFREGDKRRKPKHWSEREGLYYYGTDRLYIPRNSDLRTKLLHDHHDIPTAGHQGFERTLEKIAKNYYWTSLREDVMRYVQSCDTCQRHKVPNKSPAGLLKPLPIPDERFKTICLDFVELPNSHSGKNSSLIITDKLSHLIRVIPMQKSDDAQECAKLLLTQWVCTGKGLPNTIVSDRDAKFTSAVWKSLMEMMQIQTCMSTARHQQTNGQAENAVKMAKNCLRSFADYKGRNWEELAPLIEYALNNSISSATGCTPFSLAYGFQPDKTIPMVDPDLANEIQERIRLAQIRIARSQDRMEAKANEKRSIPDPIKPGERVLLKRDGINWPAESESDKKLLSKYLGPFTVKTIDENGNYQLELPRELRIHDRFAPDVVKKYYEPDTHFPGRPTLEPIQEEYTPETEYEVEQILDHRVYRNQKQFLIRWKGYTSAHDTWEPIENGKDEEQLVRDYERSRGGVIEWKIARNPKSPKAEVPRQGRKNP